LDPQACLENLYISPLEACNLNCKYCYTTKTKTILENHQILSFVSRYQQHVTLKSIVFCGGEVFILNNFPKLINTLLSQNIFVSIITNGTIDRLTEISDPKNCQLIVSLDGPKAIHDHNRGPGNFDKSVDFIKHALALDFPVHIFYLVTKDSYPYLTNFTNFMNLPITYLTDRLGSLTPTQVLNIKHHYPTYPSKNFGCFQLALQSDGLIYGCCESTIPLASLTDPISKIIKNFKTSLNICVKCPNRRSNSFSVPQWRDEHGKIRYEPKICDGCCNPNFLCGYPQELGCQNCQQVVKLFNP